MLKLNYPFRFAPIFKPRIWGGRRLEMLGKTPPAGPIGESWEISDHADDVSVVANGPLRGRTLRELLRELPDELLGPAVLGKLRDAGGPPWQFPLLIKWLDVRDRLSIQVHPPDGHPRLPPGERGKTECWFVIQAESGAVIYLGLRRGLDRTAVTRELTRGALEQCLNMFPARAGDFFFVPAGTVHAIGAGLVLAEIQQSSDTTFRLFDWNRVDPSTGRPRDLEVEAALDCIDFSAVPRGPVSEPSGTPPDRMTLLAPADCPDFAVDRRHITQPVALGEHDRFHILVCTDGSGEITGGDEVVPVRRGDVLLLPARGPLECRARPHLNLLDTWISS
jgi:mannose-6-phosphate isomerase